VIHLRAAAIAALWAVGSTMAWTPAGQVGAPQVFRSRTDEVLVPTVVTDHGALVTGLTPGDFALLDNGVRQSVTVLAGTLPLDVTLVVDASASVVAGAFEPFVQAIAGALDTGDRIQVVTFGSDITVSVPMQPSGARLSAGPPDVGSFTALNDALLYALVQPAEADRRAVIVALTDARDNWSWLAGARLPSVAARSDATLYALIAGRPGWTDTIGRLAAPEQGSVGDVVVNGGLDALKQAAHSSGGEVYDAAPAADALAGFVRVLQDCRSGYLLAYVPRGVKAGGWHDVTVTVHGHEHDTVRARKGYGGS